MYEMTRNALSEGLARMAAARRASVAGQSDALSEASCCDCRQAQVVNAARDEMPDPADCRPDLDALVAMTKEGCRGMLFLDDDEWRVICDEMMCQIAIHLRQNESIDLPNLGRLEIVYGDGGPYGRLTLAQDARP